MGIGPQGQSPPYDLRRKDAGREIAVAAVADDEDDGGVLDGLGNAQGDFAGAGGGDAAEDAFFGGHAARHVFGLGLADAFNLVDPRLVENFRQVGFGPLADTGDGRALFRLGADDADGFVLFLQVLRHAHDGAGGAHGADEMGDSAFRVAPDFRARRFVVGAGIVTVAELVEDQPLAFALHLLGHVARIFHAARLGREHDLGAVSRHALAP